MSRRDHAIQSAQRAIRFAHDEASRSGNTRTKAFVHAAEAQMWATLATIEDEPVPADATPSDVGNVSKEDVVDEPPATDGLRDWEQVEEVIISLRQQLQAERECSSALVSGINRVLRKMNQTWMFASPADVIEHLEHTLQAADQKRAHALDVSPTEGNPDAD